MNDGVGGVFQFLLLWLFFSSSLFLSNSISIYNSND
jgi:hypothetical protein